MTHAKVNPFLSRTPSYVVNIAALKKNLKTAAHIKKQTGCKILLATKGFALPVVFPLMAQTLDGTTASGLYEARLGRAEFQGEVHTYAPAYNVAEITEIAGLSNHIYVNSPGQLARFLPFIKAHNPNAKIGVRVNPLFSTNHLIHDLYDPCAPFSRFGVLPQQLAELPWNDISIFHVHALCQASAEDSANLINHLLQNFSKYLKRVDTLNLGGGHYFNAKNYDLPVLIAALKKIKTAFPHLEIIMEPSGGLVVDAGWLVARVLDIHHNDCAIAMLDASAKCHMPDILDGSFKPEIKGALRLEGPAAPAPATHPHRFILGGKTCMTGDVIGTYAFETPLTIDSQIWFENGLEYNFVQMHSFNGTPLPDIALLHEDGHLEIIAQFGYDDFRKNLGRGW